MITEKRYTLSEIERKLRINDLPFSGITALGSTKLRIIKPAFYAGVAMHASGYVRPDLIDAMVVSQQDRFREEDPYTDQFIENFPVQIKSLDSRFEYDVNRDYDRAIYDEHKRTWGLQVWRRELTEEEKKLSLAKHQEFHDLVDIITAYMLRQNRYVVFFDMHSYCYQRESRRPWYEDPKPEVNVGTKAVNHTLFGSLINSFMLELAKIKIDSRTIRVRENDIFNGGYLSRRLCAKHFNEALVLAIEFKKLFMDEWSGELHKNKLKTLVSGFQRAAGKLITNDFFD